MIPIGVSPLNAKKVAMKILISYKADIKVDIWIILRVIFLSAITFFSNLQSKTTKFDALILAIFDKIMTLLCKNAKDVKKKLFPFVIIICK